MPTLAQQMQAQTHAEVPLPGRIVGITHATNNIIVTAYGDIPNGIGVVPVGGKAVTIYIDGAEIAIGWLRP